MRDPVWAGAAAAPSAGWGTPVAVRGEVVAVTSPPGGCRRREPRRRNTTRRTRPAGRTTASRLQAPRRAQIRTLGWHRGGPAPARGAAAGGAAFHAPAGR